MEKESRQNSSSGSFSGSWHLRISVHAKPWEPRPSLVFEQNRLVASMGLLPMHGGGLRALINGKPTFGIGFELANRVYGARPVLPKGRFLWFEPVLGDPQQLNPRPSRMRKRRSEYRPEVNANEGAARISSPRLLFAEAPPEAY